MCGIVGYIGNKNARNVIINGLLKLEYRGYDSSGMALLDDEKMRFNIYKDIGRVNVLSELTKKLTSNIGIGHTRWATHGKVDASNAHPHKSSSGRFIIVHNGVVENYKELKEKYLKNTVFRSETDTEVIAHLIEAFASLFEVEIAITKVLELLEGSYALLIIDNKHPNILYSAKDKPPLLIGKNKDGITISSDVLALVGYADEYHIVKDKSFIKVEEDNIYVYDYQHNLLVPEFINIDVDDSVISKGDYPHFMLKEINEQPTVIRNIVKEYIGTNNKINIDKALINDIKQSERVYIIAAGTSLHAGLVIKPIFEHLSNIPVEVHIASEFAYNEQIINDKAFFIFISQSGETADLRTCLQKIIKLRKKVLTITNVKTSTLAREANYVLDIFAGKEIAVASTKAYVAQITVLTILVFALTENQLDLREELLKTANSIEDFLSRSQIVKQITESTLFKKNAFYLGRGRDYATALEASLKLKEVSYIHAEGFAAGELKHGTIALIEKDTPVIGIISDKKLNLNTRSNLQEVISRGAKTVIITLESLSQKDDQIILKDVHPLLTAIIMVVPTQLIAYYAALNFGCDVDKPRNLAKSVTVE